MTNNDSAPTVSAPLTTTFHWIFDPRPGSADGYGASELVQILHKDGMVGVTNVRCANSQYKDLPWAHCPYWNRRDSELEALRREVLLLSDQVAILREKLEEMK